VAPSSTAERTAKTAAACRGFVYAASMMGITGTRDVASSDAAGSAAVHAIYGTLGMTSAARTGCAAPPRPLSRRARRRRLGQLVGAAGLRPPLDMAVGGAHLIRAPRPWLGELRHLPARLLYRSLWEVVLGSR
jgi:tryptophan synthase alpha chain